MGKLTKEEILKIQDDDERIQAIAHNMHLFGCEKKNDDIICECGAIIDLTTELRKKTPENIDSAICDIIDILYAIRKKIKKGEQ